MIKLREGGKVPPSVWTDIQQTYRYRHEITGYGTQKPIRLAERIIQTSSNEGDIVMDCFAGCAYTALAAERLKRRWIACDINPRAWTVFKRQFDKPQLGAVLRCLDSPERLVTTDPVVTVFGPKELPVRTSERHQAEPATFTPPERVFKVPASIIPESEMLERLLELSGYTAWCCGFANRQSDGTLVRTTRNFHLDHIDPKSKDGSNQITNRAPLCPHHNIRKSNNRIHLSDYRELIAHSKEMLVEKESDLINLAWAYEEALRIYAEANRLRNPQPRPAPPQENSRT